MTRNFRVCFDCYTSFMPATNCIKLYRPHAYYHMYNRGIHQGIIFRENFDYQVLCNYLEQKLEELASQLSLHAYALMPNHYHLLIQQHEDERAIVPFMQCTMTRFSLYMKQKYNLSGRLFQNCYKAALIPPTKYQETKSYILNNPAEAGYLQWPFVGTHL